MTEQEKRELKPCPFCGGEATDVIEGEPCHENSWIQCMVCGAMSDNAEKWNTRAPIVGDRAEAGRTKQCPQCGYYGRVLSSDFVCTKCGHVCPTTPLKAKLAEAEEERDKFADLATEAQAKWNDAEERIKVLEGALYEIVDNALSLEVDGCRLVQEYVNKQVAAEAEAKDCREALGVGLDVLTPMAKQMICPADNAMSRAVKKMQAALDKHRGSDE